MQIDVTTDPTRVNLDTVLDLLRGSYWSAGIRRDVLERGIANSVVVGAYDAATGRQVGFARAVTDKATFAWLCDVIVDPDFRSRGVATRMVRSLMEHPELQTLRRWCLATRDAHRVYAPLGFVPVPEGNWLEFKLDPRVWSDSHSIDPNGLGIWGSTSP